VATAMAFIGGTGLYHLNLEVELAPVKVNTEYGEVQLFQGNYKNADIYFMARHGGAHSVPPHLVNYRANISALKLLGVQQVFATAAVGSLQKVIPPGSLVVIDQFIDFTKNRSSTFFSGKNKPVVHTDFTEPYCPVLRKTLLQHSKKLGLPIFDAGTYVCTEGPRFESSAEISMFSRLGGDLVGMTNVPEVVLAREAGLCYATIAPVTNYAAGISSSILTHEEVIEVMDTKKEELNQLFSSLIENGFKSIENGFKSNECRCQDFGKYFKVNGQVI